MGASSINSEHRPPKACGNYVTYQGAAPQNILWAIWHVDSTSSALTAVTNEHALESKCRKTPHLNRFLKEKMKIFWLLLNSLLMNLWHRRESKAQHILVWTQSDCNHAWSLLNKNEKKKKKVLNIEQYGLNYIGIIYALIKKVSSWDMSRMLVI